MSQCVFQCPDPDLGQTLRLSAAFGDKDRCWAGRHDRRQRLSRAATGDSIEKFSRSIKVTSVAGGLLDHVRDDPAKIGDGLIRPVEAKLAQ